MSSLRLSNATGTMKEYSTVSETFISLTLTNVEFRKSRDFFAWILRGSSVGFAWNSRESSVSFAKHCEIIFVECGNQA